MPDLTRDPLIERAKRSLLRCFQETGRVPSAISYRSWRASIPEENRRDIPSSSSIVPMVWRTWNDARAASGVSEWRTEETFNGPKPKWTNEDCLTWVARWLDSGAGTSLAACTVWIDKMREKEVDPILGPVPSVSTIRLRLGMPWSEIVAAAQERRSRV